jgi:N-6 DNA Methylase
MESNSSTASAQLKAKIVAQVLKDPMFAVSLNDASSEIVKACRAAPNEATVESVFERVLYATLRDVGILFSPIKEAPLATRRHRANGRADTRIGALVIEFKQPSTLASMAQKEAAQAQIEDYLTAVASEVDGDAAGFVTDGIQIAEVRVSSTGVVTRSAFVPLSKDGLLGLVRSILSLSHRALTPANLIADFCGQSLDGALFRLAREFNSTLSGCTSLKTEMLRTEWQQLFRFSHDDGLSLQRRIEERRSKLSEILNVRVSEPTMEYQAIFALHTAYALVLKFMAFRVVSDVRFGTVLQEFKPLAEASTGVLRAFCATLEDGELFRQIGILNLLEGDFFSWYADEDQWNEPIAEAVRDVVRTLGRYEDAHAIFADDYAVDLFRQLYEATLPQTVRASFGEFYTPYWLAEHVLDASYSGTAATVLDPCCGSGTFIVAAIGRMRRDNPAIGARELLSRIAGIDLNPLAVLTARIHFFIHIADLLDDVDDVIIPIFLGDASNVPELVESGGSRFYHYELRTLKTPLTIDVPCDMASDIASFSKTMFRFEEFVKAREYDAARSLLVEVALAADDTPEVADRVTAMADAMIELDRKDWNGIWARIITNFIATARIGPFSDIVGNPPWIDWKSLPSEYREKVKTLCIDRGLFSGAGRTGGINLNICALIAHVSASNWLAPGGKMSFLMPKELINQSSYEGWRNSVGGANVALVRLHDWDEAGHPFEPVREDFMTFVFESGAKAEDAVPVAHYKKKDRAEKSHLWRDHTESSDKLTMEQRWAGPLVQGKSGYTLASTKSELERFRRIAGSCEYIGREGIEFYPQEIMVFEYLSPGPKAGTAWMRNLQVRKSKYKIPQQRILLETKYLFPLAKGPGIEIFNYSDMSLYVAFPYDESNPHSPIDRASLRKSSPLLLGYYERFKEILLAQTHYSDSIRQDGEYYGLARTGPYSFKDCYVGFRDNTKWAAAVITDKLCPWGERKRYLFQNHAVSICERSDKKLISEDEAFYVAGIFNSPSVERYILASSDSRSFKIRPPIHVALFDPSNGVHRRISELAREATECGQADRDSKRKEIEVEYLKTLIDR